VLVLVALLLPLLIGFLGLAIEVGYVYAQKRQMQNAADAAAQAGARALFLGQDIVTTALAYSALNGFDNNAPDITVTVNHPPDNTSAFAGDDRYVQVIIERTITPAFLQVVWSGTFTVRAKAVAWVNRWGGGVLVLSEHLPKALKMSGSAQLTIHDGAVHVNSDDDQAIYMRGNTLIDGDYPTTVVGQVDVPAWKDFILPSYIEGAPVLPDPLAHLPEPEPAQLPDMPSWPNPSFDEDSVTCTQPQITINWGETEWVDSGKYNGAVINWGGQGYFTDDQYANDYDYVFCDDLKNHYRMNVGSNISILVDEGSFEVSGGSGCADGGCATFSNNTSLTIRDGDFKVTGGGEVSFGDNATVIVDDGDFTVSGNRQVTFGDNATVVIRDGDFSVSGSTTVHFGDNTTIIIDNGSFKVSGNSNVHFGNNVQIFLRKSSGDADFIVEGSSNVTFGDNLQIVLTEGEFKVQGNSQVSAGNNVRFFATDQEDDEDHEFEVQGSSIVTVGNDAEFTLYQGDFEALGNAKFLAGDELQILASEGEIEFEGSSELETGDNVLLRAAEEIEFHGPTTFGTHVQLIADEGEIEIEGAATVTGREVFMFAGESLEIEGSGSLDITPPSDGVYKDILYFQSRSSDEESEIEGAGRLNGFNGIFYSANGPLKMEGSGQMTASFVVDSLEMSGASQITVLGYDSDQFDQSIPPRLQLSE